MGILVWDLNRRQVLSGHTARVRSVALHPRGNPLITSSFDRTLVVWDGESGQQLQTIPTDHASSIIQIGFSPDGKSLASLDAGGSVILWSNPDGAPAEWQPRVGPLAISQDVLIGLAFLPDSQWMATGDFGGMVRLWDWASQTPIGPVVHTQAESESIAVSADGSRVYLGSFDETAQIWQVDLSPWAERACRVANRNLTEDEWESYLPDEVYRPICP